MDEFSIIVEYSVFPFVFSGPCTCTCTCTCSCPCPGPRWKSAPGGFAPDPWSRPVPADRGGYGFVRCLQGHQRTRSQSQGSCGISIHWDYDDLYSSLKNRQGLWRKNIRKIRQTIDLESFLNGAHKNVSCLFFLVLAFIRIPSRIRGSNVGPSIFHCS